MTKRRRNNYFTINTAMPSNPSCCNKRNMSYRVSVDFFDSRGRNSPYSDNQRNRVSGGVYTRLATRVCPHEFALFEVYLQFAQRLRVVGTNPLDRTMAQ